MSAPIIEHRGEYTLKIHYWYSEIDKRPYYSHALFKGRKNLIVIPTANKKLTFEQVIGMYQAKLLGK